MIIWMMLLDQFVLSGEPVSIIMHAVIFYLPTSLQRAPWQFPSCTVKLQIQACTLHGCKTTLLSWSARQSQSLPAAIRACQGHQTYVHGVQLYSRDDVFPSLTPSATHCSYPVGGMRTANTAATRIAASNQRTASFLAPTEIFTQPEFVN